MNDEVKKTQVEAFIEQIKGSGQKAFEKEDYEGAMAAISAASYVHYHYNQYYTDVDLEKMVKHIWEKKKNVFQDALDTYRKENNTVLFYDGFGLDTRGVAIMYLNALKKNGYRIIYVTNSYARGHLPEITKSMQDAEIVWEYVSMGKSYIQWVEELMHVIIKYEPKAMFFYTTPYDVSGAVSFGMLEGKADRYLIDLTDHAFWLGTSCNDYFCGSREMSASNQVFKRLIPKEKLIKLGVNLIVDEEDNHEGLPFDVEKEKYIFSGGALYKTLGDNDSTFYKMIDLILENNVDLKFLYAGTGDATKMELLMEKYPGRVFLIDERKDFYYLISNCVLYLNTYPMFGGMMMKYCANAGKIPLTLRHNADSDGLLINQKKARIEYDTYEELVEDANRLLSDEKYLKDREKLLEGTIITEQRFVNNVRTTIEEHCTDYQHEIIEFDTSEFQRENFERFDLKKIKSEIVDYNNRGLFVYMPWMYGVFAKKIFQRAVNKIKRIVKEKEN